MRTNHSCQHRTSAAHDLVLHATREAIFERRQDLLRRVVVFVDRVPTENVARQQVSGPLARQRRRRLGSRVSPGLPPRFPRFGGHGVHVYDVAGTEVDYWTCGDFAQNEADVSDVEESMARHLRGLDDVLENADEEGYARGVAAGSWLLDGNSTEQAASELLRSSVPTRSCSAREPAGRTISAMHSGRFRRPRRMRDSGMSPPTTCATRSSPTR
jgi:hypothetical protein